MIDVERSAFALGAAGFEYPYGALPRTPKYLTVANDLVAGQATGPAVTVTLTGRGLSVITVPYGTVRSKIPVLANVVRLKGNGAFVELTLGDEPVDLVVRTVVVQADAVGLAKDTTLLDVALANGGAVPADGRVKYVITGTGVDVPTVTIGGSGAIKLNGGANLGLNVELAGEIAVANGDNVTFASCTFIKASFTKAA